MKIPPLFRGLLIGCLSALAYLPLCADDNATATAKLSAPGKPATLRIDMPWADIHIKGVDGDTVTVESSLNPKGKDNRDDGLRRLDDEVSFELTEHDNIVTLSIAGGNPGGGHDGNFQISVPRTMGLDIKTETGGDLDVKDVTGDLEITNMNGEVTLDGIVGSAVVSTMNGEVRATYAQVPLKLVSITSMNGEIDLRIPGETKANVRLRTHNGCILTDFDDKQLKTKSEGANRNKNEGVNVDLGLVITVHQNGNYQIGTNPAVLSLAELTKTLTATARSDKNSVVTIRSEENSALASITAAMDACRKVGLNKIRLQSSDSLDAGSIGADAARSAAEAVRVAVQAANDFAEEVSRQIDTINEGVNPDARPRPPRAPRPPQRPITGGKLVSGTLNGGGNVDIKISTMNGEIKLRQTEARSGSANSSSSAADQASEKVRVIFKDPDNFTDVSERFTSIASTAYLDELREYVQKTATPFIATGNNLVITFLDIDLAGDIRPDKNDIRFMTGTTLPRAHVKFQLFAADGKVLKEGDRKLSDLNYQQSIRFPGQDEPLFYDKQLLKDWLTREFKTKSK